jgi:hypothetical protein
VRHVSPLPSGRCAGRDGDHERLEIDVVKDWPGRRGPGSKHAGRTVEFDRLLAEGRRREWAAGLGRRLPVTRT